MRIGFDVSQTGQAKAGCGYLAYNLISHLLERDRDGSYLLYRTFGDFFWDEAWRTHTVAATAPNATQGRTPETRAAAGPFWRADAAGLDDRLGAPDVIHSNNFFCPTNLTRSRLVYSLYDLSFLKHPEWTTEENRAGCLRGVFDASLCADLIVAISHFSRRHFLEVFPHYPAERVVVFPLASRYADRAPGRRPSGLDRAEPDGFWLAVGTIEPRKNYVGLLEAYARVKAAGGRHLPLIIVGKVGWLEGEIFRAIETLGLAGDVQIAGYLDDDELKWLYQHCFALVYPTFWEGFGLPVIEALSQGAAVITSDVSSLPEVTGEAGIMVDPHDRAALAAAMGRLLEDAALRASLRERAVAQAARFRWTDAARIIAEGYRQAVELPPIASVLGGHGAGERRPFAVSGGGF